MRNIVNVLSCSIHEIIEKQSVDFIIVLCDYIREYGCR